MPRRKTDAQEKEEQQVDIEESFVQLEEIIEKLEVRDSMLEESSACYGADMKLVKSLGSQMDKVEGKIQILSEGDGDG